MGQLSDPVITQPRTNEVEVPSAPLPGNGDVNVLIWNLKFGVGKIDCLGSEILSSQACSFGV